ncbi:PilZ domain-containing protein [Desulfovibrio oxamicus]|uniref:PilZ domain-containing protein n=1 Tax=Nitratidesulfovibrio oxamicus TaxID=32016 RepID=A0ABS0J349_9BACT|nr:PilZ domain-containing protein [Nitratidesulfovibrio oxamicus]MBG3876582.1 PilZ domain-containing protein [Nitratidesulfovibrio oxamicus]
MTTHDEFDDFDFTLPSDVEGERRAYRTSVPGLEASVAGKDGTFPVENVSAVGIAMHAPGHAFAEGEDLRVDLLIMGKPYITALPARVARLGEGGLVGCELASPDFWQEARLDKLVLEVQKRMIAQRKAESEKRDAQAAGQHRDGGAVPDASTDAPADAGGTTRFTVDSAAGTELDV